VLNAYSQPRSTDVPDAVSTKNSLGGGGNDGVDLPSAERQPVFVWPRRDDAQARVRTHLHRPNLTNRHGGARGRIGLDPFPTRNVTGAADESPADGRPAVDPVATPTACPASANTPDRRGDKSDEDTGRKGQTPRTHC